MKRLLMVLLTAIIFLPLYLQPKAYAWDPNECLTYTGYYSNPALCMSLGYSPPSGGGGSSPTPNPIPNVDVYSLHYWPILDQYRIDYEILPAATRYRLDFMSPSDEHYYADYSFAPTGIHYLTCNGTYRLFFYNSGGTMIGKTDDITTDAINAPTCESYADGQGGKNDLDVEVETGTDGTTTVHWTPDPDTETYEIWKDGEKIGETTGTETTVSGPGAYSIIGKDSEGNITKQSDFTISQAGCDPCKTLGELLACPYWDDYMNELTGAIAAAIPPPPDWHAVSQIFSDAFIGELSDYLGTVPAAPTKAELATRINVPMPTVDNSVPAAQNLVPEMPSAFNSPIPFDLSDAPVIDVTDESQPFIISDPLSNLTYDAPEVKVFPGDARNNSGGIAAPSNAGGSTPKPSIGPIPSGPAAPAPSIVPVPSTAPAPTPSSGGTFTIPIPGSSGGGVPIPSVSPGTIPIPSIPPAGGGGG